MKKAGPKSKHAATPASLEGRGYRESLEPVAKGITRKTSSWKEGSGRRSSAVLGIDRRANKDLAAAEIVRFMEATGAGTSPQEHVLADIGAAKAYARSVYRKAGIPNGDTIWWIARRGKKFWRSAELNFEPSRRRGWRKVFEHQLPALIEKGRVAKGEEPFGQEVHFAARLLKSLDVFERELGRDAPDRWKVVLYAQEFEECRRIFLDRTTAFLEDPEARTMSQFLEEKLAHDAALRRSKRSALQKHLPALQAELDRFAAEGRTKNWQAALVKFAKGLGVVMSERSIYRQIKIEIDHGNLKLPEVFWTDEMRRVTGSFLSLHKAYLPPAVSPRLTKRRGETCDTKKARTGSLRLKS